MGRNWLEKGPCLVLIAFNLLTVAELSNEYQLHGRHKNNENNFGGHHHHSKSEDENFRNRRGISSNPNSNGFSDLNSNGFGSIIIDSDVNTQIRAQSNSHAFFHCKIFNLQNQTVSWIRARDARILFIGEDRITADDRFSLVVKPEDKGARTLILKYVTPADSGNFECQVSTVPKKAITFHLQVVEPTTSILGDDRVFVDYGRPFELRCAVTNALTLPNRVFWHRNDKKLPTIDNSKAGQRLDKDYTVVSKEIDNGTGIVSTLYVKKADFSSEGVYMCGPANLPGTASVRVQVLYDERTEAMQLRNSSARAAAKAAAAAAAAAKASGSSLESSSGSLDTTSLLYSKESQSSVLSAATSHVASRGAASINTWLTTCFITCLTTWLNLAVLSFFNVRSELRHYSSSRR